MPTTARPKIQHRWLVPPDEQRQFDHLPARRIVQAFHGPNLGMCVRITDGATADLTHTIGHGFQRHMVGPAPLDLDAAQMMFAAARGRIIRGYRRFADGFKLDTLEPPFDRVMIAEHEKDAPDRPVQLPTWLQGATEVTHWLSKRSLANAAAHLDEGRTLTYEHLMSRVLRVAVTGGPCSGKTRLKEELHAVDGIRACIHPLPEVATIVIEQALVKAPIHDPSLNRAFQNGIYDIQRTLEELAEIQARVDGKRVVMTDRGTIDGCAYLAGGKAEFCRVMGTTEAEEFARYDRVIMLAPPPREVWDALKADPDPTKWNPARSETYEQALALSDRIRENWRGHPGFRYVDGASWEEKAATARRAILAGIGDRG